MTRTPRRIPRSSAALRDLARELGIADTVHLRRIGPSILGEPWDGVTYEALAVEGAPGEWREALVYVGRVDSPAYWEARYRVGRKPAVKLRGIEEIERVRWLADGFRTWRGRPPGSWSWPDPEAKLRAAVVYLRKRGSVITHETIATEVQVDRSTVSRWWRTLRLPWPPPPDWR